MTGNTALKWAAVLTAMVLVKFLSIGAALPIDAKETLDFLGSNAEVVWTIPLVSIVEFTVVFMLTDLLIKIYKALWANDTSARA